MRISAKTRRALEISANIAILIVAIIVVRNFIWSRWQPKRQSEEPTVGGKVSLKNMTWDDGPTLVIALQEGCRYCEESAAFYRSLRDQRSGSRPRMVAVLPGDKSQIARYLSEQRIVVDEIVNLPLSDIKVSGTPTLLLVDRTGNISGVWIGKLEARKEAEAAQRILNSH